MQMNRFGPQSISCTSIPEQKDESEKPFAPVVEDAPEEEPLPPP
jgi:hypothetical protein